jgi:hypothetical protein
MSSAMHFRAAFVSLLLIVLHPPVGGSARSQSRPDPFGFLEPTVQISDDDRRRLDERDIIIRILPASGHELAAVAVSDLSVGPEALLASVKNIGELKKSSVVPEIGRFSARPRLEDLRGLTLDDVDIDDIAGCPPDDCDLKLAPEEIMRLQSAMSTRSPGSRESLEREFRAILLERVTQYLSRWVYPTRREFSTLLQHSPLVQLRMPQIAAYLEHYPAAGLPDSESFLYWSKETYARKPIISMTHVAILHGTGERDTPEVIIASRDVYASRYTSGSFVLMLLFRGSDDASPRYLVYLNRTWVDGVRALWRPLVERRIKSDAKKVFADVRARIERKGSVAPTTR